jgi:endonuclease YncB( thermonuclease family)
MIEAIIILAALLLTSNRQTVGAIKKTKFLPLYINGKVNKALNLDNKKYGVYLIKRGGVVRYIGYSSSQIYKTITRHFQSWEDRQQIRITYPKAGTTIRIIYTNTPQQAQQLERALIIKHQPPDNPNKYEQYTLDLADQKIIQQVDEIAPF